jgi:DNA-binding GntR family transcriptional regulator
MPNTSDPNPLGGEPVSRTDLLVQAIRRSILDGTLAPGTALSEREIAGRFGVSKTPVRDALRLLRSTGLVEVSSFQRVTVRNVDAELIHELYQSRLIVEPEAIGMAIDRRGPAPMPEAHAALTAASQADEADDVAALGLANRSFHRELYAPCGNRFLVEHLDHLQDLTALAATVGWRQVRTNRQEALEHAALLAAYEKGERTSAVELIRGHVSAAAQHLELLMSA